MSALKFRNSLFGSIKSAGAILLGQGLFFLSLLIVNKKMGVETLGLFNQFASIGMLAGSLVALRLEMTCLTDDASVARRNFFLASYIAAAIALLVGLVYALLAEKNVWIIIFGISFFVQQASSYFFSSQRRFYSAFAQRIYVNGAFLVFLLLVPHGFNDIGISLVYAGISAVGAAYTVYRICNDPRFLTLPAVRDVWSFVLENRRFPLFVLPSSVLASVLNYSLPILFPAWFGASAAGQFALAYRFGFFPVSLVGQAVGGVLRREALDHVKAGSLRSMLMQFSAMLVGAGSLYCLVGWLFAEFAVGNYFPAYKGSVAYFLCMMPIFFMQILYIPVSQVFVVLSLQKIDFALQALSATLLFCVLFACHRYRVSAQGSVLLFSVTACVPMLLGLAVLVDRAGRSDRAVASGG